jgi:thioredoxin reductase
MPPRELLAAGRPEVSSYGGRLIDDTLIGVEPGFQVRLANASRLGARRILVATGLRDELPDIPGVRERWGRDLLHCPRTAMATRSATSRSACWGARRRLSSTRC